MKKYLITAATAFALGAGTMQIADLGDVATTAMAQTETLGALVTPGAALAQLDKDLQKIACPLVEARWGKGAPCDATVLRQVHFYYDDQDAKGSLSIRVIADMPGEWAPSKGGSK